MLCTQRGGCASQFDNLRHKKYLQVSHSHYCFAGLRSSSSCTEAFTVEATLHTPTPAPRFIAFNKIYRCHCSVREKGVKLPELRLGGCNATFSSERHFSHLIHFSFVTLELRYENFSCRPTLKWC